MTRTAWSPWDGRPQVYGPTPYVTDKKPLEKLRELLDKEPTLRQPLYLIEKGWKLNGVFRDGDEYQGLCFNPHLACWFHLTWDHKGKCKTGGCRDGKWDLIPPELARASSSTEK